MAGLPGRRTELPLIRTARLIVPGLLLLLSVLPGSLAGQEAGGGEEAADARVRAFVEAGTAATRFREAATPAFFGGAGLQVSSSVSVGGALLVLPGAVDIGRVAFQDLELLVGYAGLTVDWVRGVGAEESPWSVFGSFLAGAGNADVRDAATTITLASDNFLVLRPGGGVGLRLASDLVVRLGGAYRVVAGVEDLRGLSEADLRDGTLFLGLRLSGL